MSDTPQLPEPIDRYLQAHDVHDTEATLAAFEADAEVTDEGETFAGTDRIRHWLDTAASEYTYTRTLTGFDDLGGDTYIVRNHLAGNFPGGEVDLEYRFEVGETGIRRLTIAP